MGCYKSTQISLQVSSSKHHILLTRFPTGDISFARVKSLSIAQYRAQRILEEPVVEKPDFRLFKKIQMRGAREIDAAEAYLLIRWSEAI